MSTIDRSDRFALTEAERSSCRETDEQTTIRRIKEMLAEFSRVRDWDRFHTPKDLAVALAIETGELLEHVRFLSDSQVAERLADPANKQAFAYELADCFWALVRAADVSGVDLARAMEEKLLVAAKKYPIESVRGKPNKYTDY
jgi:NTP pyrophosphatase (non-canonical NTP hydrolase)